MPCWWHRQDTGVLASANLSMVIHWLSLDRDFYIEISLLEIQFLITAIF